MAQESLTLEQARRRLAEHEREGDPVAVDYWRREVLRLENPKAYADVQAARLKAQERAARELTADPGDGWIGQWRDSMRR